MTSIKRTLAGLLIVGLALFLMACGGNEGYTTDDVVQAFKDADLAVENTSKMTKEDYGMAPMKADKGVRFIIPELGEDKGGRILTYSNDEDLAEMKEYYDSLGEGSAMLFSWTATEGNVLVQINGDLPEEKYNAYVDALKTLGE